MPEDYGLKFDKYEVISGSAFLFRSGSIANSATAISSSLNQIIAVTCSANFNNRLTKLTTINANATITITSGSSDKETLENDTKLILRYYSGSSLKSEEPKDKIPSASDSTIDHLLGGIETNIIYIDIPLLNNDDSFQVAYKTVRALTSSIGHNKLFTAALVDDGSTFQLTSSLGENMKVGTSFEIRNSSSYKLPNDYLLSSSGFFTITSLNSGSVATTDFSGTEVQVGGMQLGTSFMIGGGSGSQAFDHNIIQEGSGFLNQAFFEGFPIPQSASLGLRLDPDDKTSGVITGSGTSKLYMSSSGQVGLGTTNPRTDFDIRADQFRFQTKAAARGIRIDEEGNLESFNEEAESATTGSELILSYTAGGSGSVQLAAICKFLSAPVGEEECNSVQTAINLLTPPTPWQYVTNVYGEDSRAAEKILNINSDLGASVLPGVNDTIGSLRWIIQSSSIAEGKDLFNKRTQGGAASITSVIASSDRTGVTADMLFKTAQSNTDAPTEVMRISSDGKVSITGSLSVTQAITSSIVSSSTIFIQHVTSSQNISASGNINVEGTGSFGRIEGGFF